jgi:hypothetical protein
LSTGLKLLPDPSVNAPDTDSVGNVVKIALISS